MSKKKYPFIEEPFGEEINSKETASIFKEILSEEGKIYPPLSTRLSIQSLTNFTKMLNLIKKKQRCCEKKYNNFLNDLLIPCEMFSLEDNGFVNFWKNENNLTDIIATLFETYPAIYIRFLDHLGVKVSRGPILCEREERFSIESKNGIQQSKRADISINKQTRKKKYIVIEHKINHKLRKVQIDGYLMKDNPSFDYLIILSSKDSDKKEFDKIKDSRLVFSTHRTLLDSILEFAETQEIKSFRFSFLIEWLFLIIYQYSECKVANTNFTFPVYDSENTYLEFKQKYIARKRMYNV